MRKLPDEPAERLSVHPDTQPLVSTHYTLSGHALAPVDSAAGPQPGMMLGPYRLLRPLGQGGMGQVWLAQQTEPLKREVAVKLLSRTLDDRVAEAWFLVERQALAMLMHPYIAQIYDAGQLPGGVMFFAMEHVEGSTLDRWVCDRMPSLELLVELYERVCQGIQHAHQRGLIHRDIKPSNLLVTEHAGQPLPKIIDFGVAIGGVPGQSVSVRSNAAIGTRAYMAPEQAQPGPQGIDARADVYGLGATLAALLCLRLGISADGGVALSHFQAAQRASSMSLHGEPLPAIDNDKVQRLRRATPKALRAILLKAMAPDREQRYESAAALASDLQRWRGGYPVQAVGNGSGYALRCFLRRHSWASGAAIAAVIALLGGITVALYGLGHARQAEAIAEQRRVQAEDLVGVMLGDLADKLRPLGRLDLLETVGAEAMRYLSAAAASDSTGGAVQRARALRTLGEVYVQRQQTDQAKQAFSEAERTLAQADPAKEDAAQLLFERGNVAYWLGYLALQKDDLERTREHFDAYLVHAVALQPLTVDSGLGLLETSYALNNLGTLAARSNVSVKAIEYYERSIALKRAYLQTNPEDDGVLADIADSLSWIGSTLAAERKPLEALEHYRQQLKLVQDVRSRRTGEVTWVWREAVAGHLTALLEIATGNDSGVDRLRASLALFEEAARADPTNRGWSQQVLVARIDHAWAMAMFGDLDAAERQLVSFIGELESAAVPDGARANEQILMRAQSRLALIRALAARCPEADGESTSSHLSGDLHGLMNDNEPVKRDQALWSLAIGICMGDPNGVELQEAITLAQGQALRQSDDGLQIEALVAAAFEDWPRLERIEAVLDGLGYDHQRARRLTAIAER